MAPSLAIGVSSSILLSFLAAAFIRSVTCKLPRGFLRLVSATPVFTAFALAPICLFDRERNVIAVLLASAFLLWWGNFKVLALCWGRGPLETFRGPPEGFGGPLGGSQGDFKGPLERSRGHSKREHQWLDYLAFAALLTLPVVIETKKSIKIASPQNGTNAWEKEAPSIHDGVGIAGAQRSGVVTSAPGAADSLHLHNAKVSEKTVISYPKLQWGSLLGGSLAHGALFFGLVFLLDARAYLPEIVIQLVYVLFMYTFMMFSFPLFAAFASAAMDIELLGHFDRPWLSNSLADFWGNRWNLTANRVLRDGIYFPLKEQLEWALGCARSKPIKCNGDNGIADSQTRSSTLVPWSLVLSSVWRKRIAKGIAAVVTFFISGVMHEVIIYYATGEASGEWTAFFTLHGVAFLVELELVIPLAKSLGVKPPMWLQNLVTLAFFLITAQWLFFPPVVRSGLDTAGISEFRTTLRQVTGF